MVRWDKVPSRLNRVPYRGSEYAFKISKQFAEEHGLCKEKECCRYLPFSKHAPPPTTPRTASFTGEAKRTLCTKIARAGTCSFLPLLTQRSPFYFFIYPIDDTVGSYDLERVRLRICSR